MHIIFYADRTATIYNYSSSVNGQDLNLQNTGKDEIIDISKTTYTEPITKQEVPFVSRGLIWFDLNRLKYHVTESIAKAYMNLTVANDQLLNDITGLEIYPVSESWDAGNGKFYDYPANTGSVNWEFRITGIRWGASGSKYIDTPITASVYDINQYYQLNYSPIQIPDFKTDITTLVNNYIPPLRNYGYLIKFSNEVESSSVDYGKIQFYSVNTHTIYKPKMDVLINDYIDSPASGTVNVTQLISDSNFYVYPSGSIYYSGENDLNRVFIYYRNLEPSYSPEAKQKIRLNCRATWQRGTYSLYSNGVPTLLLPKTSYFAIYDLLTNEPIIPFSDYTRISTDMYGNYFKIWMSSFIPERYYKIKIKMVHNGEEIIFDNNDKFFVRGQ